MELNFLSPEQQFCIQKNKLLNNLVLQLMILQQLRLVKELNIKTNSPHVAPIIHVLE
jgi:hypothetical protein